MIKRQYQQFVSHLRPSMRSETRLDMTEIVRVHIRRVKARIESSRKIFHIYLSFQTSFYTRLMISYRLPDYLTHFPV